MGTDKSLPERATPPQGGSDLREAMPVLDRQGIRLGNFWISWDKLAGWEGEDEEARKAHYEKSIIAKSLMAWRSNFLAALSTPSETPASPNRYGVDTEYFRTELSRLTASLDNRPAEDLARYLRVLADVATPSEGAIHPVPKEELASRIEKLSEENMVIRSLLPRFGNDFWSLMEDFAKKNPKLKREALEKLGVKEVTVLIPMEVDSQGERAPARDGGDHG